MKRTIQQLGISQSDLDAGLTISGSIEVSTDYPGTVDNLRAEMVAIDYTSYEVAAGSTTTVVKLAALVELSPGLVVTNVSSGGPMGCRTDYTLTNGDWAVKVVAQWAVEQITF